MKSINNFHPRSNRYKPIEKKSINAPDAEVVKPKKADKINSRLLSKVQWNPNIDSELNILSLGAGVQSSTLLLMSLNGDMPPLDYVIFADTGWEPKAVYDHLKKLKIQCRKADLPLFVVQNKNEANIAKDPFNDEDPNSSITDMPLYIRKKDGVKGGMIQRRCTGTYKVRPISKMLTALRKQTKAKRVRQWIGISYDELHRMRNNPSPNVVNYYPLVENEIDRNACHVWLKSHGWTAPKSSCVGCPYHSDDTWSWLRENCPDDFREAVKFDKKIRIQNNTDSIINGDLYLHRARIPLEDVVFKIKKRKDANNFGQQKGVDSNSGDNFQYGFANECEGLCGV